MNSNIRQLEPKDLWNHFCDLNAVPRPSKKEERIIQFMVDFGKSLLLKTIVDDVGNVIIFKPATAGMENRKTIVMQSHLDMVHQKNNETIFDFDSQGIEMMIMDNWVKAKGTTLGADNGLGVAAIMAVLSSKKIAHPAIEALFTIDEETGMTGAKGLKPGVLKGEILLNLDTEEDDEIDIGCAGGIDINAQRNYEEVHTPQNTVAFSISVKGLQGGHSGMDIYKGLGNANKIMNRLLFNGFDLFGLRISQIKGGGLRNAIPRESNAIIVVDAVLQGAFLYETNETIKHIKAEFATTEPNLNIEIIKTDSPKFVMDFEVQEALIKSIYTAQNGVYKMSSDMENLVETSNNVAKVLVENGTISIQCLTRSSVESSKEDLANSLRSCFELARMDVDFSRAYPGWKPNVNSEILEVLSSLYKNLFQKEPKIVACHAGLECGILGQNYPEMDMVSFGPTILGAHSPDERVSISSVQKFWKFLLEILKNIPKK